VNGDELELLADALSGHLGGRVQVLGARRLSAGASRTTWFVEVDLGGEHRTVVVQRERPGGTRAVQGMAGEAALLRAAAAAGVPVAPVLAVDRLAATGDALGAWIALGLVDGETIPRRILRGIEGTSSAHRLLVQCATALAGIHRLEVGAAFGLSETDQVAEFRSVLDLLGDPQPVFELAFRWLERHRPTGGTAGAVVHGDFRLGNVVVGDDGLRAVLDWELAHVGDPIEDLGWFTARAWRFGSDLEAGGLGTTGEFLDAYTAAGGHPVAADSLRWWQVLATLKWGIMCLVQAATHQSGTSRSVELAAIGRRAVETHEDLLELIAGPSDLTGPDSVAEDRDRSARRWGPLGGPGGPTVRPSAAELLDAVAGYLEVVREEASGRVGFHARVAGNVVDQVARELRLGPLVAERHRVRLEALGVADDGALAAAIRDGELDVDDQDLLTALRGSVRDALSVVHPDHVAPGGA